MGGIIIYIILIAIVAMRFMKNSGTKPGNGSRPSSRTKPPVSSPGRQAASRRQGGSIGGPLASDGHRMSREQDVSCRRFGHQHEEFDTPRYIPHDDPEDGFILLNGVKMRLSEADRYEDRI